MWIISVLAALLLIVSCGEDSKDDTQTLPDVQNSEIPSISDQEQPGGNGEVVPDLDGTTDDLDGSEQTPDGSDPSSDLPIGPPEDFEVETITSQGAGYGEILRVKSTGELLFSPEIKQLRELLEIGEYLGEYSAELTFILLDEEGNECYAYPVATPVIKDSNGEWFDLFLQGQEIDCGFCPTAGRVYTVELSIIKEERVVMAGTWYAITASMKYTDSAYYTPDPLPSNEELVSRDFTVTYSPMEGGVIEGQATQNVQAGDVTSKVTAVAGQGYVFAGWSDGKTDAEREGDRFIANRVIYAKFTKLDIDVGIASIFIETQSGDPILSKVNYMDATIRIEGAGEEKFNITAETQIRGRGNSSFSSSASQDSYNSKNSYRLKLAEKTNLLGVGKAENRDWVLQANKFDASNLRNYFVWNLANQLGTFPFVPNCTWVNLYINGDYRGVYMVTDHVEAAEDRVEVDDSSEEPDKGYLVELDFRGADELNVVEGLDYFYVPGFYDPASGISNPREWVIKSDVTDVSQTDFIRAYIISCHTAIMNGERETIEALVDVPSLVDMFILEELSKDVDAGGSSMFLQKDTGGKLYCTAPWDYDFGFGTYGPAVYADGFVCESLLYDPNIWFASLIEQKWFLQEVHARLESMHNMIELAKVGVRINGEMLADAADRNDRRWGIYGQKFHSYVAGQVSSYLHSYDEHIDFLCDWIDERYAWMVDEIAYRLSE